MTNPSSVSRRRFLYTSGAMGSGLLLSPGGISSTWAASQPRRVPPNEKLNIAAIGAGGQGATDTDGCASENIVALCDVDENRLRERGTKYPKAKLYRDYRKMLEE